ncbi:hypothetical protein, partial [Aeromonas bivalvium]|uniref:hypothetical protein n=1 Tax=Aeromonas bivalvium TaxID=440079 RepID=UPI0038D244D7
ESGAVAQPTTSEMSRIQAACQGIRRVPSGGIGECRTSKLNSRLTGKAELFEFENSFMNTSDIYDNYASTFKYISNKNPACKIIFIPFPVKLKCDEKLNKRFQEQLTALNELKPQFNNLHILPERNIQLSELLRNGDIYHFNDSCYLNYAKDVFKEII